MVNLKCSKKLLENLPFSLFTFDEFWMFGGIVDSNHVLKFKETVAISVHLFECFLNNLPSNRIHFTSNDSKELIIVDFSVLIDIHIAEKSTDFLLSQPNLKVSHCLIKFVGVESHRTVVVHDPKISTKANNTRCASLLKGFPKSV